MGIIEAIKMITLEEGIEKGFEIGVVSGMEKGMSQGIEKGEQRKTYEFVKNLLLNTDFNISKIAVLTNCSDSFVEKVKEDLNRE